MSMFPEDDRAEIEVEKIKLRAMEAELKKIRPLYEHLTIEIGMAKDDIKRMEEKLEKNK